MPKLTLSADTDIIRKAKKLARRHHTSVSSMFGRIIRLMSQQDSPSRPAIGTLAKKMTGIITLPKGKTDRQLLEEALMEKYGL